MQNLLHQPPSQPQFLHLLKENRLFGEIAVLSDAERPPRPTCCAGTARSCTRCPILSPSPSRTALGPTHRTRPGTAPPSLVPRHRHVAAEPSPSAPSEGRALHPSALGCRGRWSVRFHAGLFAAAALPYRRRDLCWLQISGWSQLDLFDFCRWLLGRGSARRDFDLEFKPTPIRATEPLITTLQPLRLKQQQKQTQNLVEDGLFFSLAL